MKDFSKQYLQELMHMLQQIKDQFQSQTEQITKMLKELKTTEDETSIRNTIQKVTQIQQVQVEALS